jgi:hypothetical protein
MVVVMMAPSGSGSESKSEEGEEKSESHAVKEVKKRKDGSHVIWGIQILAFCTSRFQRHREALARGEVWPFPYKSVAKTLNADFKEVIEKAQSRVGFKISGRQINSLYTRYQAWYKGSQSEDFSPTLDSKLRRVKQAENARAATTGSTGTVSSAVVVKLITNALRATDRCQGMGGVSILFEDSKGRSVDSVSVICSSATSHGAHRAMSTISAGFSLCPGAIDVEVKEGILSSFPTALQFERLAV